MSSSRVLARTAGAAVRSHVCALCHARQLLPVARSSSFQAPTNTTQPSIFTRNYAQKLDVKRLRADVDRKARVGWYKMTKGQKILLLQPDVAEAIYNDFTAHKDRKEYGKLIKQLMTKYNVTSEHMSGLALMTYSIPDLSDPAKRAMLPPSPHKSTAGLMLQGCADIQDPLAIKHIMTAVYLSTYTTSTPSARPIAQLFPKSETLKYRKSLELLQTAGHHDPEALTLHGLFLEQEARPTDARALYEKALQVPWVFEYNIHSRHPAQLPIPSPWNALGYLLNTSPDPAVRERAKWAFEQGATKADDPLSYYELASFQRPDSAAWLKCVSKAAASGHSEAMLSVARFYRNLGSDRGVLLQDKAGWGASLNWLLGWRADSTVRLAEEWFEAAGRAGHKGALLDLAEWCEARGKSAEARELCERILEPGGEDGFADVVIKARGRLAGIRAR